MRSILSKLSLAALAIGLILALAVTPAAAEHVQCGDTITQDTTLDSDLLNCPRHGVIIGASGVTLNLAGHTIDGADTQFPSNHGVDITNQDGVTVTNGTITDFGQAVGVYDATGGEISRLSTGSTLGIFLSNSDEFEVLLNAGTVVLFGDSDGNLVARNDIPGGLLITGAFPVRPWPDGNVIERNTVAGFILSLGAVGTIIARNEVRSTSFGIGVSGGSGTIIARNDVSGAERGISVVNERDTLVVRNRVSGNPGDGIVVGSNATGSVLRRNLAQDNGDDGIDVESPATVIAANTANANGDLGIEAVVGVTDGGGNKARDNGNPAQCVGVSCK